MERAATAVRDAAVNGPRRQAELVAAIERAGLPREAWSGVGLWIDLVRVPPHGTWEQRRADLYGLAESWLGPPRAQAVDSARLLVQRYLSAFGPASVTDVSSWTGVPISGLREILRSLQLHRRERPGGDRPAHPGLARRISPADLPHQGAAVLQHLPDRRPGGRHLALHPRGNRTLAFREARLASSPRAGRGGRPSRSLSQRLPPRMCILKLRLLGEGARRWDRDAVRDLRGPALQGHWTLIHLVNVLGSRERVNRRQHRPGLHRRTDDGLPRPGRSSVRR